MHRCGEILADFSKRTLLFVIIFGFALSSAASAHVKWFAPYDVPGQPVGLRDVLSPTFWFLVAGTCFALWVICRWEQTAVGAAVLRVFKRFRAAAAARTQVLLPASLASFFFS